MLPLRGPLLAGAAVLCLVVGVGTGIASIALHEKSWGWFLLTVVAPLSFTLALRAGWLRSSFAAGWIALVYLALQGRPEGDYAVMSTPRGYLLLGFGLLLIVVSVVTLPLRPCSAESEEVPA